MGGRETEYAIDGHAAQPATNDRNKRRSIAPLDLAQSPSIRYYRRRSCKSVIGCATGCLAQARASRDESRWIEGFRANRRLLEVERVSYDGILPDGKRLFDRRCGELPRTRRVGTHERNPRPTRSILRRPAPCAPSSPNSSCFPPDLRYLRDEKVAGLKVRRLVWGFSCQAVVLGCADGFLFGAGKAVFRPVACDQVRGARGRGQGTETVAQLGGLPLSDACVSQRLDA